MVVWGILSYIPYEIPVKKTGRNVYKHLTDKTGSDGVLPTGMQEGGGRTKTHPHPL